MRPTKQLRSLVALLCALSGASITAGCRGGLTFEETGPSIQIQMVVPPGFPRDLVAGGDLVLSAATDDTPKFVSGTGFFQLNGVQVAVQTRDEDGDGKPDVVVSFGTNPLRDDGVAEIFLYARLAPGVNGTFSETPPLKVTARLHAGDGEVIARGEASNDTGGETIRFGPTDRRVVVSMACVSQEACNAPVRRENVQISVSRLANCPGPSTTGVVYALLDPRSSTGAAAITRTTEPVQVAPGASIDLPPVEVLPGIYRVTAVLDTTGEFEARGRVEAAGDLISSLRKTVDVFEGWDSKVDLVLDRVVDIGGCFGAGTQPTVVVATEPRSPANHNDPVVRGTALPGGRVHLYDNASCTGVSLGESVADSSGLFQIEINVADNTTTELYATVTDFDGIVSACTGGALSYVEDSAPPALPPPGSLTTDPASPSTVVVPLLKGTIEAGALVSVHLASDCTDPPAGFGSAEQLAQGLRVAVASNATSHFYLRLTDASGNASGCLDTQLTYQHDVIAPDPPPTIQLTPVPPASSTTPTLSGTVEAGSTVEIFANGSCTGSGVTGSAQEFSTGITVPVTENTTTSFSMRITDSTGNTSSCIPVGQTYVHDSVAPGLPINLGTEPSGPSSVASPRVRGAVETGSSVEIYPSSDCSGSATTAKASDLATGVAVAVPANQTTTFSFIITDGAGNRSGCLTSTLSYIHDSEAPAIPQGAIFATTPASPSNVVVPALTGMVEAGARVAIHLTSDCSDPQVASGSDTQLAQGIGVPVPINTSSQFYVVITDLAGNVSGCLDTGVTYLQDLVAPAAPTALQITPTPPASTLTPMVSGTVEAGSTVQIYTDAACGGTPVMGTAADLSTGISVTVPANTTSTLAVRVTDAAGNTSSCFTTALAYTHDSLVPGLPTSLTTEPAGPSPLATPTVRGTIEVGGSVQIFATATCTDTAVTASAGELAAGVAVPVPTEQTTTFSFIVTDAAGNVSTCLPSTLSFVHDSMPPAAPTLTGTTPASPATATTLTVDGTTEANATVRLFIDPACSVSATSGAADATGAFAITTAVGTNSQTTFFATATDAAGNASGCSPTSTTYQNDLAGPIFAAPLQATAQNRAIDFSWTPAFDLASSVDTYDVAWCAGAGCVPPATPQRTGLSNTTTNWFFNGLTNCMEHTVFVRATDTLGNVGNWISTTRTPIIEAPNTVTVYRTSGRAELVWSGVAFASGYEYCYSSSSTLACNNGTVEGPVAVTGATIFPLASNMINFSVRAYDGTCVGASRNTTVGPTILTSVKITDGGSGSKVGHGIQVIGDLDGDGLPDILITDPGSHWIRAWSPAKLRSIFTHFSIGGSTSGFGNNVSAMGDIDGDGRPDVLAGMPFVNNPGTGNGGLAFISGRNGADIRQVYGEDNEGLGRAVAGIEDVDGDGVSDAIGGSLDRVRLVSGADGTTIQTLPRPEAGDDFGFAVAAIGIVNGQPRFVVGAPQASPPGGPANAGSAYLYEGMSVTPIARVNGALAAGGFGSTVAGVGDVNGDGTPDFLVAAANTTSLTKLFLYSGVDGAFLYSIDGSSLTDELGASASSAGDVDRDGRDDFIVGAPGVRRARIYSGGTGTLILELSRSGSRFGQGTAAADADGDGRIDFFGGAPDEIITGPDRIDSGFVYWYPGKAGIAYNPVEKIEPSYRRLFAKPVPRAAISGSGLTFSGTTDSGNVAQFLIVTPNSGTAGFGGPVFTPGTTGGVFDTVRIRDSLTLESLDVRVPVIAYTSTTEVAVPFATTLGTVGDINGDGASDFYVGYAFGGTAGAGSVTIYSGLDRSVIHNIESTVASARFGTRVISIGDLDGGGRPDFAVSAPGVNSSSGEVTVYSGETGMPISSYPVLTPPAGSTNPIFGAEMRVIGDVDGDRVNDFLVGAPGYDGAAGSNTGSVFVYSGATGARIYQLDGEFAGYQFGSRVATGGDVNGDGVPDFVLGVPSAFESAGYVSGHAGATGSETFQINGAGPNVGLGGVVGILPDLNADGQDELIISDGSLASLLVVSPADRSEFYRDSVLHANVIVLGDLDGDRAAEWLSGDGNLFSGRGQFFLHSGKDGTRVLFRNGLTNESIGEVIGNAGDVNRDGTADFLIMRRDSTLGWVVTVWTSQAPPPPPARPVSLTATPVSATQIDLVWVDRATDETGYKVERRNPRSTWSAIATLPADTISYSATVTANSQYEFRVKALNATGDSAWSPSVLTRSLPIP